nr:hypothetical protein [Arenimonas daejeonensis]
MSPGAHTIADHVVQATDEGEQADRHHRLHADLQRHHQAGEFDQAQQHEGDLQRGIELAHQAGPAIVGPGQAPPDGGAGDDHRVAHQYRGHQPDRQHADPDQAQHRQAEHQLVGDRVEQAAQAGLPAAAFGDQAVQRIAQPGGQGHAQRAAVMSGQQQPRQQRRHHQAQPGDGVGKLPQVHGLSW